MQKMLGPTDFEPHVGSNFAIRTGSGDQFALLASVARHAQPSSPRAEPFTLLSVGDLVLDQRIHELRHPEVGLLEIFLVPIGPDPDGKLRYEAVFN
jgi:Domain of unknown function (DUF6916)